ncbi:MAG: transposase [Acidimicrobiales bacterium]
MDTRHARLGLAKGVPTGQQRRRFSPEFKADAVALVRSSGRSISAIARELGIGESNLGYWLKKDEADCKTRDPAGSRPSPPNLPRTGCFSPGGRTGG